MLDHARRALGSRRRRRALAVAQGPALPRRLVRGEVDGARGEDALLEDPAARRELAAAAWEGRGVVAGKGRTRK